MKWCQWLTAAALSAGVLFGQVGRRPLQVNRSQYQVAAGERFEIDAPPETVAFMLAARTRIARATTRTFAVAPTVAGDRVVLGIPLTTAPGNYAISLDFRNDAGEERSADVQVTVTPYARPEASSAGIPVVLLDGWQPPSSVSGCPMAADSTTAFGNLAS